MISDAVGVGEAGFRMKALPVATAMGCIHIGTMTGKLKGQMPATTPTGWRMVWMSTPVEMSKEYSPLSATLMAVVEGLAAALDLADGVGVVLAVLLDDRLGQLVLVGEHQLAHLEHDGGALGEGNLGPLLLGRLGAGDGVVEVGRAGGYQFTDDLAGGGVLDGDRVGRLALVGGAVDPVGDFGHVPLPGFWGVQAGPADCFVPHRQQCRLHRVRVRPVRWPDGRNRRELCTYNNPPVRDAPACRGQGRPGRSDPDGLPPRVVEICIDNRCGFS